MISHRNISPRNPSRVLILGSSGFVGKAIMEHFRSREIPVEGLSSRELDLLSPHSVALLKDQLRPDDVLMIVSAITPDKGKDVATLMKNLRMAENICALLDGSKCEHVIYISSDAVYSDDINLVRESSCCNPGTLHGVMHLAREKMIASRLPETPFLFLRPSAIYGTGDTHNSYGPNRFVRTALLEGRIQLFGNGEEKRDHLHISDLAKLSALCVQHRSEGILNVATGRATSFRDVADLVASACERKVEILSSVRHNPITHRHFDTTRVLRAFPGFRFTNISDGLAETVKGMHAA